MLAEAFPVKSLVLVDNQSFKLQADRCGAVANFAPEASVARSLGSSGSYWHGGVSISPC